MDMRKVAEVVAEAAREQQDEAICDALWEAFDEVLDMTPEAALGSALAIAVGHAAVAAQGAENRRQRLKRMYEALPEQQAKARRERGDAWVDEVMR